MTATITRTYDDLDRLTQEVTAQGTVNYTYDNASRRATMTVVGQTQVTYTYDNANRLTQIQQGTSTVTIGYDDAGPPHQCDLSQHEQHHLWLQCRIRTDEPHRINKAPRRWAR